MAAKWVGGAVAVVAALALIGRCGADDTTAAVSGTASEVTSSPTAAQPIQPALAAPSPATVGPAATTRPAPTTTSAPPTTTKPPRGAACSASPASAGTPTPAGHSRRGRQER